MYTSIVLCLLILLAYIFKREYQYFLAPPILVLYVWIAVHLFNLFLGWQTNESAYLILALPPLMFGVGFYINSKFRSKKAQRYTELDVMIDNTIYRIRYNLLYIILFIAFALMLWEMRAASNVSMKLSNENAWQNIHEAAALMEGNFIVTYSVPATYMFSGFCGLLFFRTKEKKLLLIFIASLVISLIRAFMAGNRTSLFMVIILGIMPILLGMHSDTGIINCNSTKNAKKMIIIAALMFCIMFFGIASQKYSDMFTELPFRDFIKKNFAGYFNLSSAAFVKWYNNGFKSTHGANTFRFFFAVLKRIGVDVPVVDFNSAFIDIEGTVTNAFTVAKIYVEDFGVIFMAFMLFIYGMLHSFFYKKAFLGEIYSNITNKLFCGALYIGLIGQVLVDQYVTILSMMINFFIWAYLFPRLVIKKI